MIRRSRFAACAICLFGLWASSLASSASAGSYSIRNNSPKPIRVSVCFGVGTGELAYDGWSHATGEITLQPGATWTPVRGERILAVWVSIHSNGRPYQPQGSEGYRFNASKVGRDEMGRPYLLLPPQMSSTLGNSYYGGAAHANRIGFAEGGKESLTDAINKGWEHIFFKAYRASGSIYNLGKVNETFVYSE